MVSLDIAELIAMLKNNGNEVWQHSLNVTLTAKSLYPRLPKNFLSCSAEEIQTAAILHDIGKIRWPREWFEKSLSMLSLQEIIEMKNHPQVGSRIVKKYVPTMSEKILYLIENHHNKESKDNNVLFLAACDVFCACLEKRAYRERPLTIDETIKELRKFVPEQIVDLFISKEKLLSTEVS